jgi:hypothetical protein
VVLRKQYRMNAELGRANTISKGESVFTAAADGSFSVVIEQYY